MDEYTKALNYAFLLLKYRSRSRHEIVFRLERKKYSSSLIKKVLDHLEEYRYISDAEFARAFIAQSVAKGYGKRRIECSLKKLGVSGETAGPLLKSLTEDKSKIRDIIAKKIKYYRGKRNVAAKIMRHLVARGFGY
ncbi:MAG: RecX family transcriptional regulator, partial [Candidatus Omnitrophica bacterium]|nr:RecX family transcriptional regulator [Candidatus Omnitrophota bacterium]